MDQCKTVNIQRRKTDLLEEVVNNDEHGPPEVCPTQEVEPGRLVDLLVQRLSDRLYLGLAATIMSIRLGPDPAKSSHSVLLAVFGQQPTWRARDKEGKEKDDCRDCVTCVSREARFDSTRMLANGITHGQGRSAGCP